MNDDLRAACALAVHLRTGTGVWLRAGRAVLATLGLLGWPRMARLLASPPFIWAVELGYWLVSRNRPFFARFLFRR